MKFGAVRSVEDTKKLLLLVPHLLLQTDSPHVQVNINEAENLKRDSGKPQEYCNGILALLIGIIRVATLKCLY